MVIHAIYRNYSNFIHFKFSKIMKNFINRCLAMGDSTISVNEIDFIPPIPFRPLEAGCVVHITTTPLMAQHICTPEGHDIRLPYLVVEVDFPDGHHCFDKLFLSTITKSVRIADSTLWAYSHGTFVDFVRSFVHWKDALPNIQDAIFIVTDVEEYEIKAPNGQYRRTRVYGFDFLQK